MTSFKMIADNMGGDMRDPERISMILAAIDREWAKTPDKRLGQLLAQALGRSASSGDRKTIDLSLIEDGQLLRLLGAETDAEKKYIEEEPAKAREGWAEWMKKSRESKQGSGKS